jgi:NAD kinase
LEPEIRNHATSNKDDLKKALREDWETISPKYTHIHTQTKVQSTPNCLNEVTINRGLQTIERLIFIYD